MNEAKSEQSVDATEELLETATVPDRADLARWVEEFQQEREAWELRRQQEVARLRKEGQMLTEAWERLEADKRALLSERELIRRGTAGEANCLLQPDAGSAVSGLAISGVQAGSRPGADDQNDAAWLQFQQLRRETQRFSRKT